MKYIIGIAILFIAGAFFLGKCTAHLDKNVISALNTQINSLKVSRDQHDANAREFYRQAEENKQAKDSINVRYQETLRTNAQLSKSERDLKAKLILKVGEWDASEFSLPATDAILTLGAKNEKLEKESDVDSVTIKSLEWSFAELDSAQKKSGAIIERQEDVIAETEKKNKKPHWWEIPAIITALIIGLLIAG